CIAGLFTSGTPLFVLILRRSRPSICLRPTLLVHPPLLAQLLPLPPTLSPICLVHLSRPSLSLVCPQPFFIPLRLWLILLSNLFLFIHFPLHPPLLIVSKI